MSSIRTRKVRWSGWVVCLMAVAVLGAGASDEANLRAIVSGKVVDEAGKAVAGVWVSAGARGSVEPTTTAEDGTFRLSLSIDQALRVFETLVAKSDDGRLGLRVVEFEAAKPELKPLVITLKPARPLSIWVVDGAGQPVEGAEVHLLANFPRLASGRTDERGRWATRVPVDLLTEWRIYALKPGIGFDYAQSERARGSAEPPFRLPDRLTLNLDGARPPLRIKAVDQEGKPLAGIEVGPWHLQKPGQESPMSALSEAFVKTDEAGIAMIDWLPTNLEGSFSITYNSRDDYSPDETPWIETGNPVDEVTLSFLPLERLSGRVTNADGEPEEGALVALQGTGFGSNEFQGATLTDADGRYSLRVYSEEAYVLTASKGDQVAPYRSGVVVRIGEPVEGVDLVLGPATRLQGRVTLAQEREPVPGAYVVAVIDQGPIPSELKGEGDRSEPRASFRLWTQTDADGRYELLLGPGKYQIQGPERVEPFELAIPGVDPPKEIIHNLEMPRPSQGPLAITVTDEAGNAIANAVIDGAYQSPWPYKYFTRVIANSDGTVHLKRSLDPLVLVAAMPDRSRAGIIRIDAEATEAKIIAKPTATAKGRLTDPGGSPIAERTLSYGILIQDGVGQTETYSYYFGGQTKTDAQGHFQLNGLIVGESYGLYSPMTRTQAEPTALGVLELGDVPIAPTPPEPLNP